MIIIFLFRRVNDIFLSNILREGGPKTDFEVLPYIKPFFVIENHLPGGCFSMVCLVPRLSTQLGVGAVRIGYAG